MNKKSNPLLIKEKKIQKMIIVATIYVIVFNGTLESILHFGDYDNYAHIINNFLLVEYVIEGLLLIYLYNRVASTM